MASAPKVSVVVAANVDKATAGLKKVNATIAKLTAPMRKVNRSFAKMKREAGVQKMQKAFKSAAKDAKKAASAIGGVVKQLGMVGGAALAVGVAMVKTFSTSGDLLAKNAKTAGWTVQGLQEATYILERQGATQEQVNSSMLAFSKRMGEAKAGTGSLAMFLKKTNPALLEQMKAAKNNEEAFYLLSDAMRKVKDPSKQAAMASAAFSRQGIKLSGIAKASAKEVEQLRLRARELGLVMSDKDAKAAEEFADASLNLDYAMKGLRNRIGAALAPALSKLSNQMADFAAKHGPAVRKWAEDFAAKLPQRIEQLRQGFRDLKDALQPVIKLGKWVSENFGMVRTAMIAVAAVMTGKLIIGVVALAGALKTLGIVTMATPIGWIVAGIVAVGAAIVLLIAHWDKVTAAIGKFTQFILSNNPFSLMARGINAVVKALTGFDVLSAVQNKLQNLLPDWALNLLGMKGGAAEAAKQPHVQKVAAFQRQESAQQEARRSSRNAPLPAAVAQQVGGTLKIQIDSEGRPRVKELTSTNKNVPVQVDAGMMMAGIGL